MRQSYAASITTYKVGGGWACKCWGVCEIQPCPALPSVPCPALRCPPFPALPCAALRSLPCPAAVVSCGLVSHQPPPTHSYTPRHPTGDARRARRRGTPRRAAAAAGGCAAPLHAGLVRACAQALRCRLLALCCQGAARSLPCWANPCSSAACIIITEWRPEAAAALYDTAPLEKPLQHESAAALAEDGKGKSVTLANCMEVGRGGRRRAGEAVAGRGEIMKAGWKSSRGRRQECGADRLKAWQ